MRRRTTGGICTDKAYGGNGSRFRVSSRIHHGLAEVVARGGDTQRTVVQGCTHCILLDLRRLRPAEAEVDEVDVVLKH
jgi:hypothetical protein